MPDRRLRLLVCAACLAWARPAAAQQLGFSFAQAGVPVETLSLAQGVPASFQVLLVSLADTRFDTRDLFSVGTRVTTTGGFAAFDAIAPATAANSGPFNTAQTNAATGQLKVFGDGATPVPFAATDQILLGTFTFTPTAAGTFTLTAGDRGPLDDSIATDVNFGDLVLLDPSIAADGLTIFVTPVPEPTSLLAIGAVAGVGAWWRRRPRPAAATSA